MIIDAILFVIKGVIEILLLPLTGLNIAIDFIGSIPIVMSFIQIVAYVLPWSNILPLILLVFALFLFRVASSLLKFFATFFPGIG